jgi:hypothetical protein
MYSLATGSNASNNTAIGESAAFGVQGGNNNTNIGYASGFSNSGGSANITLGNSAGYHEVGSNRLYIHNGLGVTNATNMATNSLIVGTMDAIATNQKLRINAQVQIQDGTQSAGKVFTSDANGIGSWQTPSSGGATQWATNGTNINYVTGNVGIGTATTDAKLTVKGNIHANEVKIDLNGAVAPDYVFEPTYDLKPLAEIETYIKENKHLPEVPSAKEMEKNGVQLGEMNMLLLKKVEELTLHAIEQNKKMNDQQLRIQELIKEMQQLKAETKKTKD